MARRLSYAATAQAAHFFGPTANRVKIHFYENHIFGFANVKRKRLLALDVDGEVGPKIIEESRLTTFYEKVSVHKGLSL